MHTAPRTYSPQNAVNQGYSFNGVGNSCDFGLASVVPITTSNSDQVEQYAGFNTLKNTGQMNYPKLNNHKFSQQEDFIGACIWGGAKFLIGISFNVKIGIRRN